MKSANPSNNSTIKSTSLTAISIATVIGPTPPGTGVMKPACSLADVYWTSPTTRLPLGLLSSGRGAEASTVGLAFGSRGQFLPTGLVYGTKTVSRVTDLERD